MLDLPGPLPTNIFPLIRWITLHGVVPGVHVLGVTAHREALQQEVARLVAGASEGLASVCKLFFGPADLWQDERFQRAYELMKTVLTGLLQAIRRILRPRMTRWNSGLLDCIAIKPLRIAAASSSHSFVNGARR
jgi:hypothetical protein